MRKTALPSARMRPFPYKVPPRVEQLGDWLKPILDAMWVWGIRSSMGEPDPAHLNLNGPYRHFCVATGRFLSRTNTHTTSVPVHTRIPRFRRAASLPYNKSCEKPFRDPPESPCPWPHTMPLFRRQFEEKRATWFKRPDSALSNYIIEPSAPPPPVQGSDGAANSFRPRFRRTAAHRGNIGFPTRNPQNGQ